MPMRRGGNPEFSKAVAAAIRTAKWAVTMTKWRIGFETGGKKVGANTDRSKRWQLVPFPGPNGRESAGIVDILAIRRDHRLANRIIKRGDFFEIILIQVKGGAARRPKMEDILRLRAVAKHYKARDVVLAEWMKGSYLKFHKLRRNQRDLERAWEQVDPGIL